MVYGYNCVSLGHEMNDDKLSDMAQEKMNSC